MASYSLCPAEPLQLTAYGKMPSYFSFSSVCSNGDVLMLQLSSSGDIGNVSLLKGKSEKPHCFVGEMDAESSLPLDEVDQLLEKDSGMIARSADTQLYVVL